MTENKKEQMVGRKTLNLIWYICFNVQGQQHFEDIVESVWSDMLWNIRWREMKIRRVNREKLENSKN